MANHPAPSTSWRLPLALVLLASGPGCGELVRPLFQGAAAASRSSKAVPFEGTPWVADGRIVNLALLERREGTLEVRLVRDLGFPTSSLQVFVDGALVADFWEREALALWLAPGRHRFSGVLRQRPDKHLPFLPEAGQNWTRSADLDLDLQPGPRPCLQLSITGSGPGLAVLLPPS